eukprot:1874014-Amphidinium_carterae.1
MGFKFADSSCMVLANKISRSTVQRVCKHGLLQTQAHRLVELMGAKCCCEEHVMKSTALHGSVLMSE